MDIAERSKKRTGSIFWILSEAKSEDRDGGTRAAWFRCSVEQPSPCVRSNLSGTRTSPSRNVPVFGTSAAAYELERSGHTIISFTESDGDGNPRQSLRTISRAPQLVAEKNTNRRLPSLVSRGAT